MLSSLSRKKWEDSRFPCGSCVLLRIWCRHHTNNWLTRRVYFLLLSIEFPWFYLFFCIPQRCRDHFCSHPLGDSFRTYSRRLTHTSGWVFLPLFDWTLFKLITNRPLTSFRVFLTISDCLNAMYLLMHVFTSTSANFVFSLMLKYSFDSSARSSAS